MEPSTASSATPEAAASPPHLSLWGPVATAEEAPHRCAAAVAKSPAPRSPFAGSGAAVAGAAKATPATATATAAAGATATATATVGARVSAHASGAADGGGGAGALLLSAWRVAARAARALASGHGLGWAHGEEPLAFGALFATLNTPATECVLALPPWPHPTSHRTLQPAPRSLVPSRPPVGVGGASLGGPGGISGDAHGSSLLAVRDEVAAAAAARAADVAAWRTLPLVSDAPPLCHSDARRLGKLLCEARRVAVAVSKRVAPAPFWGGHGPATSYCRGLL